MGASGSEAGFGELTHYAGFDWASDHHDVVVVDRRGEVVWRCCFDDTAEGWAGVREKLAGFLPLGVAVETCRGPAVERLLALGLAVYPLNPKAAARYRDRKAPSGVKDDQLDAWSFADGLRTDGHGWRRLVAEDQATALLRMLCRDEMALIAQRTALVLQLREALHEYYPAALEAFDDWSMPGAWAFVVRFPAPADLARKGKRTWEKFLHTQRLWREESGPRRMAIFARAEAFTNPSPAVTTAKSLLALTLARQLQTLEAQLREYRQRIEKAFDDHPDHDLFGSLPGAGGKLAPRLLGELGANRQVFESAEALQCYVGTAPVRQKSGQRTLVKMRRACNKMLRVTVHLWADVSRQACAWAQAYYRKKREQGKSHSQALRCLGQRWLKILWKMWQDRTCYNEARHLLNQTNHGSWVIALLPSTNAPQTPAPTS